MAITPVPSMTPVPHFPALSERAAGTYNASAYNFGTHMAVTFNGELLAVAMSVKNNADEALALASAAAESAGIAGTAADNAADAAAAAETARGQALAYAQAAGASAGVPTPAANSFLQTGADSVPVWGGLPADSSKLAKTGGVAAKLAYTYIDHGTIAAAGTAAISALTATVHRIQAAGNLTITFSDLISGALSGDIELHCVNFGGKTVTWPAGNWIKPDGSYATAVGNSGVTWQTAGTDRVIVMIDNGTIYYKVMR